jgi:dTDP-4-amino-4,6-dideoxygalactose transaminase
VDIDASYPTPGAQQFAAAIDDGTVAVIVAPMYGHVQSDWTALLDILGERTLILDLAQGLSLERRLEALCRRADAVTYSFGVGKGLDTGGGLVLARKELHPTILSGRRKYPAVGPLVQTIALRLLIASGLYPMIAHRADQYDSGGQTIATTARLSPESIAVLWNTKLKAFLEEVRVACERAAQLGESSPIVERVRYPEIYFGRTASHLRQVIRLNDPLQRDFLVAGLRAAGIDCAPAGEAFPCSIGRERISRDFPNAARFRNDAIRLPFLGRMSVSQFQRFQAILERTLVKYLP